MTYKDNSGHKTILGPAAFILGLAISGLTAAAANAGEITISNATAHVMEDPVNGRRIEVYMDIENSGGARDRLYSVRSKLSEVNGLFSKVTACFNTPWSERTSSA